MTIVGSRVRQEFSAGGQTYSILVPSGMSDDDFYVEAQRQINSGSAKPVEGGAGMPWWQKFTLQASPSAVGGLAGGAIGAIPPIPALTGGTSIPAGRFLGSMAGEAVSQYADPFGVRDGPPSNLQIGMAGAAERVGPAARGVGRAIGGVEAGLQSFFQSQIGPSGEKLIGRFIGPVAGKSRALFQQASAAHGTGRFDPALLRSALTTVERQADPQPIPRLVRKPIDLLLKTAATSGDVSWDQYRATMTRLGETIGTMQGQKKKIGLGEANQLYKSMWQELETLASRGTPILKEAVKEFKKEQAADLMTEAAKSARGFGQGVQQIQPGAYMKGIDQVRERLENLIPSEQIDGMMKVLAEFGPTTPAVSPIQKAGAAPSTGAIGGMVNRVATSLTGLEGLGHFLLSPTGQSMVSFMARHGQSFDSVVNAIAQASRVGLTMPGVPGSEAEATAFGNMPSPMPGPDPRDPMAGPAGAMPTFGGAVDPRSLMPPTSIGGGR